MMKQEDTGIRQTLRISLGKRDSQKRIRRLRKSIGTATLCMELDSVLGDFPDTETVTSVSKALGATEKELHSWLSSTEASVRRIARLVLLVSMKTGKDDQELESGMADSCARVRSDASLYCAAGDDRSRIYNKLIRLIREDPDTRVRHAAGRRLSRSFADMYAVDFDGLPPFSKILILDALEGHNRMDEERVERLLFSEDREAAFRSARCLQRWGVLDRHYTSKSDASREVLSRAADLGVVDYLEGRVPEKSSHIQATELAGKAGRDDLLYSLRKETEVPSKSSPELEVPDFDTIEKLVMKITASTLPERQRYYETINLGDSYFKSAVETFFPPPDRDISSAVLFDFARLGRWKDWEMRCTAGLESGEPQIAVSAIMALSAVSPDSAGEKLQNYLSSPLALVRRTAAESLASIPSGKAIPLLCSHLAATLSGNERQDIILGIRSAGSAALARCITESSEIIDDSLRGVLLRDGIDEIGVELLVDGFSRASELQTAIKKAGPEIGSSLLAAYPRIEISKKRRLLSWVKSSAWPEWALEQISSRGREGFKLINSMLINISSEEKLVLLGSVIEKAGGKNRRLLHKVLKSSSRKN